MTEEEIAALASEYTQAQAAERAARDRSEKARTDLLAAKIAYTTERLAEKGIVPMQTKVTVSADDWRGPPGARVVSGPVFVAVEGRSAWTSEVEMVFYEVKKDGKPSTRRARGRWPYGENKSIDPVQS